MPAPASRDETPVVAVVGRKILRDLDGDARFKLQLDEMNLLRGPARAQWIERENRRRNEEKRKTKKNRYPKTFRSLIRLAVDVRGNGGGGGGVFERAPGQALPPVRNFSYCSARSFFFLPSPDAYAKRNVPALQ